MLAELARRQAPHVALFIDYGPAEATYGDTLQAVHRHAWVDPLSLPGCADVTAHVRFASLARKARAAGLAADGPTTQAEFLGRLGIAERAARLMAANPGRAGEIETGVERLLSPTGMGQLFKAMAVRSATLPPAAAVRLELRRCRSPSPPIALPHCPASPTASSRAMAASRRADMPASTAAWAPRTMPTPCARTARA